MPDGIAVQGLAELRRTLKKVADPTVLPEFRDGLKDAADIVARDARGRAQRFSTSAAATIRATAGGNRAYVQGGKARLPWYGWADFGTRTPIAGRPRSVGPWARTGKGPKGGRFIYPAVEASKSRVERAVADALDTAFRRAGL